MPLYLNTLTGFNPSGGTADIGGQQAVIDTLTVDGTNLTDTATGTTYDFQDYGLFYNFQATLPGSIGVGGVFSAGGSFFLITTTPVPGTQTVGVTAEASDAPFFPVLAAVCFAPGTMILTPEGEVPVEDIRPGDWVICTHPAYGPQQVIWTGSQRQFIRTTDQYPVRIRAEALGRGVPARDLIVSPAHGLALEGHLVRAELLVNDASILRETTVRDITWHHIEVQGHAILMADGAPAESYLDTGNRHVFGLTGLAPADGGNAEAYRTGACLPVLEPGPVLDMIQERLLVRARTLFAFAMTEEPAPRIRLPWGEVLAPDADGGFELPPSSWTAPLVFVTRSGIPAALLAGSTDSRRLGVALSGLELWQEGEVRWIDAAAPAFALMTGLRELERDDAMAFRWTTGEVTLPPALFKGFDPALPLYLRPCIAQTLPRYAAAA